MALYEVGPVVRELKAIEKKCKHTDFHECHCECHIPTECGEPMVLHIIPCCEVCPSCKRNVAE